jgi:hypothetical protein
VGVLVVVVVLLLVMPALLYLLGLGVARITTERPARIGSAVRRDVPSDKPRNKPSGA